MAQGWALGNPVSPSLKSLEMFLSALKPTRLCPLLAAKPEQFIPKHKQQVSDPMRSLAARLNQMIYRADDLPDAIASDGPRVFPMRPKIDIAEACPSDDAKSSDAAFRRGQFLARQEAWEELSEELLQADLTRQLTPGGHSIARIMGEGARSDLVMAAQSAARRGEPDTARDIMLALDEQLDETPDCPAMAYVVAMAHLDLARSWRGASRPRDLSVQRRDAYKHHIKYACELADRFDPFEYDSALWAQVRCCVLEADAHPMQRIFDDYEDLTDLDPLCTDHLRAYGRDLLPRRFGTYEDLDNEARRATQRLEDVWGLGAYTWIYIGALELDRGAFRRLDPELFVEGMCDLLDNAPNQHVVNQLAAFTGLTLSGPSYPGTGRARLAECFSWLLQDHLTELHPLVWAAAAAPGQADLPAPDDDIDPIKQGRARALSTIAEHFSAVLDGGRRLVFTPDGLEMPRITN